MTTSSAKDSPVRRGVMLRSHARQSPHALHRRRRAEQINNSASLAEKFPKLKTLRVTVEYFDSTGITRQGGMKYTLNLTQSKSMFCFNCIHADCAGGDFDLTDELAAAISRKRVLVEGELRCSGKRQNRNWNPAERACESLMRYKLTLGY